MNEDEAFIRAIVDAPGDDTPRLVYADWLDDRDDPRGPYLRAEHDWAKPWRSGERPEYNPVLRASVIGLDPLWVARVSRPPVGVCCEHIQFECSGPRLTVTDLDEVKRWPQVQFPDDYTAFLLNYNGGAPHLPDFTPARVGETGVVLSHFLTFQPNGDLRAAGTLHREVNRYWNKRLPGLLEPQMPEDGSAEWYHDLIPVADCGSDNNWLMLGVNGDVRGELVFIDWYLLMISSCDFDFNRPGGSIAALLASLRTASTGNQG